MPKETFVRITEEELRTRYARYNELYFGGALPTPEVWSRWCCSKKCVGWVRYVWTPRKRVYRTHFHINAKLYNWTDENLLRVMVHEMIHIAIKDYQRPVRWWHWIIPPRQHDREYVSYMKALNARYGLDIDVRIPQMKAYLKRRRG